MAMTEQEQEEKKIIRRRDAKALGLKKYFTGKPCKHRHIDFRWTVGGGCNSCKLQDALAWKKRNKDHVANYAKDHYAANKNAYESYRKKKYKENKVIELARCRRWRERNLERAMQISQDYKKNNPERIKETSKIWHNSHRLEVRTYNRNRKKRVKANGGSHTAKEIADLLIAQNHKCANPKCQKSIIDAYHADHIMPIFLGGRNDIGNIQLLCPRCNQTKRHLHPDIWRKKIGIA